MAEQHHRATAEEWACVKEYKSEISFSCLLELLCRIEALEAKEEGNNEAWAARLRRPGRSQAERIASLVKRIEALENDHRAVLGSGSRLRVGLDTAEPEEPKHPAKPDSSLVERLALTLAGPNDDAELWMLDARAAIREVAAWLGTECEGHLGSGLHWAIRLEQEATR